MSKQQHHTQQGVQTLVHYPIAPHHQLAYKNWVNQSNPLTEAIHKEFLSLPMSPVMSDEDVQSLIKAMNNFK